MNENTNSDSRVDYRGYISEKLEGLTYNSDAKGTIGEFTSFLDENYEDMNNYERAELYYLISRYQFFINDISGARASSEKAISHLDFEDDIEDIIRYRLLKARIYNTIAITYAKEGKIFQSAGDFTKSFQNSIFCNDLLLENQVLNNIGDIYLSVGAYSQAIEMFERVESRNVERNYNKREDYLLSSLFMCLNLGICYTHIGRLDKAKIYLKRSDDIIKEIDNVLFELYREDLNRIILEAEGNYQKSDELGEIFYDKFLSDEDGIVLCDEMLSYLMDVSKRENCDYYKLRVKLDRIKPYMDVKATESQRIVFGSLYFKTLLSIGDKNGIRDYITLYEDIVNGILENYDRERGKAVVEQYEALLIRHEHISVDEHQMMAEFYRYNVQKEKEEYKRDYEKLKLINSVARAARSNRDFKINLRRIMAAYVTSIPLRRIEIWTVKNNDAHNFVHFIVNKDENFVTESTVSINAVDTEIMDVIRQGKICKLIDLELAENFDMNKKEAEDEPIYLPLKLNNVTMGAIAYYLEKGFELTGHDSDVISSSTDFITLGLISYKKSKYIELESKNQEELRAKLENVNAKLRAIIDMDGLTGIPNRRYFESKYPYLSRMALNTGLKLAVYVVDMDDFKAYNDNYGHLQGDEVLKQAANAMYKVFPKDKAVFARYGGEEFYALSLVNDEKVPEMMADDLLEAVRNLGIKHDFSKYGMVTASVGCVLCRVESVNDFARQIKHADELLYRAKLNGKNRYFFDLMENIIVV